MLFVKCCIFKIASIFRIKNTLCIQLNTIIQNCDYNKYATKCKNNLNVTRARSPFF